MVQKIGFNRFNGLTQQTEKQKARKELAELKKELNACPKGSQRGEEIKAKINVIENKYPDLKEHQNIKDIATGKGSEKSIFTELKPKDGDSIPKRKTLYELAQSALQKMEDTNR